MKNNQTEFTPKVFINTISIIHLFFTFSPVFLGLFTLYNINDWNLNFNDYNDPLLYGVLILAAFSLPLSNYLFNKKINSLKEKTSLKEKLVQYQTASIMSYAPLEGISLLGIVTALQ